MTPHRTIVRARIRLTGAWLDDRLLRTRAGWTTDGLERINPLGPTKLPQIHNMGLWAFPTISPNKARRPLHRPTRVPGSPSTAHEERRHQGAGRRRLRCHTWRPSILEFERNDLWLVGFLGMRQFAALSIIFLSFLIYDQHIIFLLTNTKKFGHSVKNVYLPQTLKKN